MKIAVITRHAISNYGSLLQAYATQTILEKLGYECEIIDYVRDNENYFNHEKTLLKRKPDWNQNLIKRTIYLFLRQPESILSGKMFETEREKYLKLTDRYTSLAQLKNKCPIADIFMTGSDQVWGPTEDGTYDPAYCLSFVNGSQKKISYAASFGRSNVEDSTRKLFEDYLKQYEALTVREDSAVDQLTEMGLQAKQVLDPTFLLTSEEWKRLIKTKIKGHYILVYQLHNDSKLGKYAKFIAKEKGLPLLRISTSLHQILRPGKLIWNPNIEKFLSYLAQADCLVTDSFHGTALAINLNVQFVEVLPNNGTATRNQSILKLVGLENRIVKQEDEIHVAFDRIDYDVVNPIIEEQRNKSLKVLKQMIEK